ncbi:MAG TPA: hypothetical protein VHT24_10505 [Pseudacidobacterium sp.]|nr:hypothetical protein [Pseudacidobacterium sp.]
MPRKTKQITFDEVLANLRSFEFDVREVPGVAGRYQAQKNGCAALLTRSNNGGAAAIIEGPGVLLGGEISHLLDRGYQKFLKTSRLEITATADHLKALHRFSEELKEAIGVPSLYNESIGTTSTDYFYDRVKGRDKNPIPRSPAPWDSANAH